MTKQSSLSRRHLLQAAAAGCISASITSAASNCLGQEEFRFRYLLGSSLYGYASIESILREAPKLQCTSIDLWPRVHGDQREQLDTMGEESFRKLLENHRANLGCITQYKLGPFGLAEEFRLAQRLGCKTIVTGAKGPSKLQGAELRKAIRDFIEQLKPHVAIAEECGVVLAIENHANNLMESEDSLRIFAEYAASKNLAIAFAPYHLPQNPAGLAKLLEEILPKVEVFYAWQHGKGSMTKQPREDEWLQLPGFGPLDFKPMVDVLRRGAYRGWTELFMHPYPRGLAIHESVEKSTEVLLKSKQHLESLL